MKGTMTKSITVILATCFLCACSGDDSSSETTTVVYDTNLYRSCDAPGNETLQQSAQGLTSSGIDVLDSRCAILTGVAFLEVCGAPIGLIYLHDIRAENLPDAQAEGYLDVDSLADFVTDEGSVTSDVSYEVTQCPE